MSSQLCCAGGFGVGATTTQASTASVARRLVLFCWMVWTAPSWRFLRVLGMCCQHAASNPRLCFTLPATASRWSSWGWVLSWVGSCVQSVHGWAVCLCRSTRGAALSCMLVVQLCVLQLPGVVCVKGWSSQQSLSCATMTHQHLLRFWAECECEDCVNLAT